MVKSVLLLFLTCLLVLFKYREVFRYHFDPVYWENYYYESQWNVPNSKREITDQGVYRYIGYRLVNGENPFNVDYWVPPFGKYFYGLSAKYLNNPYLTSVLIYVLSCLVFYLLSKEILSPDLVILSTAIYQLNPLLSVQIGTTALDLPVSFVFLLYLYFFVKYLKNDRKFYFLAISSVFLGLAAGTKPPFYPIVTLFFSSVFLFFHKKIKLIPVVFLFTIFGYFFAYFCYFAKHPNPIPWLRLHQKVVDFQKTQGGVGYPLNTLQSIFIHSNQHYGGLSYQFSEWYLLFPLFFLSLFKIFVQKTTLVEKYLILFTFVYLGFSPLLDFWPRYFVPVLAPLILIFVSTLKNKYLLSLCILYSLILLLKTPLLPLQ